MAIRAPDGANKKHNSHVYFRKGLLGLPATPSKLSNLVSRAPTSEDLVSDFSHFFIFPTSEDLVSAFFSLSHFSHL